MLEKLQKVEDRFGEIESQLSDPSVISDVDRFNCRSEIPPVQKNPRAD